MNTTFTERDKVASGLSTKELLVELQRVRREHDKERRSFCYLVRATVSGHVKIGYAKNPEQRMYGFQIGCWEPLELAAKIVGGAKSEFVLHYAFCRWHVRGEWFAPNPAIADFIEVATRREVPTYASLMVSGGVLAP